MAATFGIFLCWLAFCFDVAISDKSCIASLSMKFYRTLQIIESKNCDSVFTKNIESCLSKDSSKEKEPKVAGNNKQFLLMFLNNYHSPDEAYILIHANEDGHCNVSSPHVNLQKSIKLKKGKNKIDFGRSFVGKWYTSAIEDKGILVETSVEVSVHEYLYGFIGGGSHGIADAFSIFPTSVLSKSYTISAAIPRSSYNTDSYFGVVASEDDTYITIELPSGIKYRPLNHDSSQNHLKVTLKKQQTMQIWVPHADSSGTNIKSNKPIAVFSASHCYSSSTRGYKNGCNLLMHMMPPIDSFDSKFLIPLSKKTFIRLSAGSSNAKATISFPGKSETLTYDIDPFKYKDIYDNVKNNPVMIKSTRGLLVTHFNSEAWWGGNYISAGNTVVPGIHQYLSTYDFYVYDLGKGNSNFVPFNIIDVIVPKSAAADLRLDNNPLKSPVKQVEAFGYVFYTYNISPGQHKITQIDGKTFGLFVFQSNGDSACGFSPGFDFD